MVVAVWGYLLIFYSSSVFVFLCFRVFFFYFVFMCLFFVPVPCCFCYYSSIVKFEFGPFFVYLFRYSYVHTLYGPSLPSLPPPHTLFASRLNLGLVIPLALIFLTSEYFYVISLCPSQWSYGRVLHIHIWLVRTINYFQQMFIEIILVCTLLFLVLECSSEQKR
jgi:hypothetical protein